ncbi:MAG: hypothetical protein ACAI18_00785 [Gemmatimonadales bacterium]
MTATLYCGDVRAVLARLPERSVQTVVTDLTDAQIGYLAGLIDGEGGGSPTKLVSRRTAGAVEKL